MYSQKDILILSFYEEERRALSTLFNKMLGLNDIAVENVDAAQGSESPFVTVSMTRPGIRPSIGVFQDQHRQCVALSRAQDGLVVAGHEKMGKTPGAGYKAWDNVIRAHERGNRLIQRMGYGDWITTHLQISSKDWVQIDGQF
ncbi:hypothetical protein N7517_008397 [Penicillium concentricum]|uniref:DNA2/NAM7 helicase-like C-terminal domain-containing protein n=1 Tax=Penicillium concentricum TaxID=293559 RepID=A0A9W9RSN0_9EURO|nr:uncharacterized protein N7517_008397 [Penicillium concentricum]KAJ5365511.1 hypothetical protein N7517_008397 [Penicillium concentricum]